VAVLGRKAERGEARAEVIRAAGGAAQFFATDAMERDSVRAAHQEVIGSLGAPTILLNAAGGITLRRLTKALQPGSSVTRNTKQI